MGVTPIIPAITVALAIVRPSGDVRISRMGQPSRRQPNLRAVSIPMDVRGASVLPRIIPCRLAVVSPCRAKKSRMRNPAHGFCQDRVVGKAMEDRPLRVFG